MFIFRRFVVPFLLVGTILLSGCDAAGGRVEGIAVGLQTDMSEYQIGPAQQLFLRYENESGFTVYSTFSCGRFLEEVSDGAVVQEWPLFEQSCDTNGTPLAHGEAWLEDFLTPQFVAIAGGARLDESVRYRFRIRFWRTPGVDAEGEDEYSNEFKLVEAGGTQPALAR